MIPFLYVYFCHNGLFFILLHVILPQFHSLLEYGIRMCKDNNILLNRAKKLKFFFFIEKKQSVFPPSIAGDNFAVGKFFAEFFPDFLHFFSRLLQFKQQLELFAAWQFIYA